MTHTRDPIIHEESNNAIMGGRLNWLRAAVLGANDGIVSVSSVIVGVAGASNSSSFILTAGVAALVAGAFSMAVGEYVSVSTQRDTEKAMLDIERYELEHAPEKELNELVVIYERKGLSRKTAEIVAEELTKKDAFAAHVDAELGIDPNDLTNPTHAAFASGLAFISGGVIPVLAIVLSPAKWHIPAAFVSVVVALIITGALSAHAGEASKSKATIRVLVGGILAMAITYGVGSLFGVAGI
jgi:VIT1/CCC1 family predicted Fe2+/Mn2+ transporter